MATAAQIQPRSRSARQAGPIETTLLDLVQLVGELTDDDQLVVATIIDLIERGEVRLIGNFRGQILAIA